MPFCPICKNEYREGIKECHECKVPLVDDLSEGPGAVICGEQDELEEILQFCEKNGLKTGFIRYIEEEHALHLFFNKEELEDATKWIKAYMDGKEMERLAEMAGISMEEMTPELAKQLQQEEMEEMKELQQMEKERISGRYSYVDKREKAAEYKSSAFVLIIVGVLGLVALVLIYLDILPGFNSLKNNYLFIGVMGFLYLIFLITGVMSYAKVKVLLAQALEDEDKFARAEKFMDEMLTKEAVDRAVGKSGDVSEEEIYFKRAEYMGNILKDEFPDIEETLCEKLIEERYYELYESNDN